MKKYFAYLNEKGQDLVEYTLILAFCAVLLTGLNSDAFNNTIKEVFERGVFDDVSTYITAGAYAQAGKAWSQNSRRTLNNIQYSYGRYILGEDIVDNALRIDADKAALNNVANFFLGMTYETLKEVFNESALYGSYIKENGTGNEILLLNFYDEVYGVEDKYDPNLQQYVDYDANTQQYVDGATAITTLDKSTGRKFAAEDVFHWLQGDYGRTDSSDPNSFNGSYNSEYDFDSSKRYFYSNQMIDPDGTYSGGTIKRNIRIQFTTKNGVVTSVTVKAQRNGQDVPELTVTQTSKK